MDIRYSTEFGIFEWDSDKNDVNLQKHKINFYDAVNVFADDYAVIYHDPVHSLVEERFKIVGRIGGFRISAVFFTDREEIIRIIPARKATKSEIKEYEHNLPD